MGYLKRFSDLTGGIAAFFATVFLFGKYMEVDPEKVSEGKSKLEWFFSSDNTKEYRQYLVLIALIVLTIAVSIILKKYPAASLVISVLPMCQSMSMLFRGQFYEFAHFYVAVCALMFGGHLYEAFAADKENGSRQAVIATRVIGALGALLATVSVFASKTATKFSDPMIDDVISKENSKVMSDLKPFGFLLSSAAPEKEVSVLISIALVFAACVIIGVLLRKIYFIDAMLAFVPFVLSVSALHEENLATAPMLVIVPGVAYFVCCLALVFRKN